MGKIKSFFILGEMKCHLMDHAVITRIVIAMVISSADE